MATPKTAITRFDLSLSYSEFSVLANRLRYIGLHVLPALPVAMQAADFLRVLIESVLGPVEDTLRAPKGAYKRGDFKWDHDSYATEDHGVEEVVDDRTIAIYGHVIRAEQIHVIRAINRVLQAFEQAVANAVFNTTTWTGASLTTGVLVPWSTPATADPLADFDAAIEKVTANCGVRPNAVVLSDWALLKLGRTHQIQDLLKFSGKDDPKALDVTSVLAQLFRIPKWLVGQGRKNSADEGQNATIARLWDPTMCMICNVAESDSLDLEDPQPCIGRTLMWTEENTPIPGVGDGQMGCIVEEYREEARRGGVIRARNDRMIKILHPEAGHLLTGVTV